MNSKSDLRHEKNVQNFSILVDSCLAMGVAYRPVRANLKVDALRAALDRARLCLSDFQATHVEKGKRMVERNSAFEDFHRKITRIYNALRASRSNPLLVERAKMLVRKIRGEHDTLLAEPDPAPDLMEAPPSTKGTHKTHTSYDAILGHAHELLLLLKNDSGYATEEDDLKVEALEAWLEGLAIILQAVQVAHIALNRARDVRNQVLYAPNHGLIDLAADCKAYLLSAFGSSDPEYKRIKALVFHSSP